jgi:hypothetical protein
VVPNLLSRLPAGGLRPTGMDQNRAGFGTRGILLLLLWAMPLPAWAQTTASSSNPAQKTTSPPGSLPVELDLNRIRTALLKEPVIRFDDVPLRFYVEIYGRQTRFWDFVGTFDLKNGPVPGAGMTHQEFLNQVTPKNMYFGSPSIGQIAKVAAEGLASTYLLSKLREALKHAPTEADARRIQAQIDRELAALAGK